MDINNFHWRELKMYLPWWKNATYWKALLSPNSHNLEAIYA